jgi:hydrogenase-4 component F
VTELVPLLAVLVPAIPLAAAGLVQLARTPAQADRVNVVLALVTAAVALVLAVTVLARGGGEPLRGDLYLLDGAAGVFLALIAVIGLCSALVSPAYLRTAGRSWLGAGRSRRWYYSALYVFWAVLLAVPIAANLALAWLLVEATTAASALLIAFTGRRDALEAGWKYLVLTTLGLSVALLGIVVLAIAMSQVDEGGLRALDWHTLERNAAALPEEATLVAFVLMLAGLATEIGWAPVHNWLPDAHSARRGPGGRGRGRHRRVRRARARVPRAAAHVVEGVVGDPARRRHQRHRDERPLNALTVALGTGLLALTVAAVLLPGSDFVETLARGAL